MTSVMLDALALVCGIALLTILATTMFVALRPLCFERQRELMLVTGLLASIAIVKCLLLPHFDGYPQDIFQFLMWGEVMARSPGHVYDPRFICRYMPGYLYALWAMVAGARDLYLGPDVTPPIVSALRVIIRIPPLIADLLLGLVIFAWLRVVGGERRRLGDRRDLAAVMLFALNPALVFTSVIWGQNDSALTLPITLAVLMASQGNFVLAGAAAALAVLVKLQGVIVVPILGVWILLHGRVRDWIFAALSFLATVIVGFVPFQIGRPWDFLVNVIASSADYFPYTSLNAFNLMALVFGMRIRDSTTLLGISAFSIGMLLMGVLYLVAIFMVWRERSPRALLFATFLAYLGFFVLPTRIHERYLYFAVALLTPLALDSWITIAIFATLTVTFLVNQIVTLRYLNHITSSVQHDSAASVVAVANLAALALAIAYGMFFASKSESESHSIARVR